MSSHVDQPQCSRNLFLACAPVLTPVHSSATCTEQCLSVAKTYPMQCLSELFVGYGLPARARAMCIHAMSLRVTISLPVVPCNRLNIEYVFSGLPQKVIVMGGGEMTDVEAQKPP